MALLAAVPSPPPELPATEAEARATARLRVIQRTLDEGEAAAQLWWGGWLFGLATASAAQAVAALSVSAQAQPLLQVGALKAGIGAASVLLVPFPAASGAAPLRALPEGTAADRLEKLRLAESLLHRAAAVERLGRSWVPRAGGLLLNGAASLWLWLRQDRPAAAALTFALGTAVGEAKIWTQPTAAIEAEQALGEASAPSVERGPGAPGPAARRVPAVRWSLGPVPGGLLLIGNF